MNLVRRRWPVALAVVLVLVALGLTLLAPRSTAEALSPASTGATGSRALAQVLGQQGVDVRETRSFTATRDALRDSPATVLVTDPDLLSRSRLRTLVDAGDDLVLVAPGEDVLAAVAPGVTLGRERAETTADPGCAAEDPSAAGTARAGGQHYTTGTGAGTACYGGSYVELSGSGGGRIVVLGQPQVLTNRYVTDEGDATLALRVLGHHDRLVWYLPDPLDSGDGAVPVRDLLPDWLLPALGVAALTIAVALLWRGRRLGRLVTEPLPVVVRAAETVEGHGRLYASAGASGRAAEVLRAATVRRLRAVVRLDAGAPVSDVADQTAWLTGRPPAQVRELLAGSAPRDDPALVRLAGELDLLERDVRGDTTSTSPTREVTP